MTIDPDDLSQVGAAAALAAVERNLVGASIEPAILALMAVCGVTPRLGATSAAMIEDVDLSLSQSVAVNRVESFRTALLAAGTDLVAAAIRGAIGERTVHVAVGTKVARVGMALHGPAVMKPPATSAIKAEIDETLATDRPAASSRIVRRVQSDPQFLMDSIPRCSTAPYCAT